MTAYPLATLAPTVDSSGISVPSYEDVYNSLIESFKLIYGTDLYVAPDSQDGQLIAVFAKAIFDSNQTAVAIFQSFSPTYAQNAGLSSVVKINGIQRLVATKSTVDLTLIGQVGTVVLNGKASSSSGDVWELPPSVTIPVTGSITVTATAAEAGAIQAPIDTIQKIATPTKGWQSVTNSAPAVIGNPIETDAELRKRQTISTALPALSILASTIGAVARIDGVSKYKIYENDTNSTDSDGIPAHSISVVVEGGDSQLIADAIAFRKTPGTGTHGTTSVPSYDPCGVVNIINFFRPTPALITVEITISPFNTYSTTTADLIKAAVSQSLMVLEIGDDVYIHKLYVPANLPTVPEGATFDITQIRVAKNGGGFGTGNISNTFNELVSCLVTDVTVIVL